MSQRVEATALYPQLPGEDAGKWTDRVLKSSRKWGTNRQCSIGWHGECSDRTGESCMCLCHDDATRWFTVEGHAEGGVVVATRTEQGKHRWPPKEGEPATAWGHWIMGVSPVDAAKRAVAKQRIILGITEPPTPAEALASKVAGLAALAAKTWADYAAGDLDVNEFNKQKEWTEADLIEAWREYTHSLT